MKKKFLTGPCVKLCNKKYTQSPLIKSKRDNELIHFLLIFSIKAEFEETESTIEGQPIQTEVMSFGEISGPVQESTPTKMIGPQKKQQDDSGVASLGM